MQSLDLEIETISPKLRHRKPRMVKGKVPQYLNDFEIDHPDNGMILQQIIDVGVGNNAHNEVPYQLVHDDLPDHTRSISPQAHTHPNNDHSDHSDHSGQVRDTRIQTPSPVMVSQVTRFSRPGHVHGQAPSVVNTVSTVFIGTRAHPGFILGQSIGDAQDESGEDFAFNANHPISRMIRRHRAKGDMTEVENLVRACKCTYISARNVQSLTDDPDSREEVIAKQILRLDEHRKKLDETFSLLQSWLTSDPPIFGGEDMAEFADILNAYCMASVGEHAIFEEIVQDTRDRAVTLLSNRPNSGAWYADQLTKGTTHQTLASTLAKLPAPVGSDIEGWRENHPKNVTFKDHVTGGLSDTSTAALIESLNKKLGININDLLKQQSSDLGRHKSLTEYTVNKSPQGKSVPKMEPGKANPKQTRTSKTSKLLNLSPEKLKRHTLVEPYGQNASSQLPNSNASFTVGGGEFQSSFPQSKLVPGTQIRTPSGAYGPADSTHSPGSRPASYAKTGNMQSFQGQPMPSSAQNLAQTFPSPTLQENTIGIIYH